MTHYRVNQRDEEIETDEIERRGGAGKSKVDHTVRCSDGDSYEGKRE